MKTVITVLFLSMALVSTSANAQNFQGEATYKTHRNIDIKMDSTKMSSDMQEQMQAMLKKQFQKTYKLSFNKEASVYKEEETLDAPQVGGSNTTMSFSAFGGGGSDILYKNTKNNTYTDQKDTMGKLFLVKDDIEKIEWKLESETKFIGEYQCFKATFIKMVQEPTKIRSFSINKGEKEKEEEEEKEPEMIERVVTAWYTPQVPVSTGPANYQGLPGLILEIHDGKLSIVCTKIIINPENKVDIEEPTRGKEIDKSGYDKIMDKKRKEMMERFAPKNGRLKGEAIEIRIGG